MEKRENYLYYGDNIDILRNKIDKESVDLCYIDPPFNSKRNYNQIYNNIGKEDKAQTIAFVDTWEWDEAAIKGFNEIQSGSFPVKAADLIISLQKILGNGSLLAYLTSLTIRINEIHKVLKKTGSFFIHCDPAASHYIKLICDSVFCSQGGDFLNEIIWHYKRYTAKSGRFQRLHDVIFWYSKGINYTFNDIREGYGEKSGKKDSHYKQDVEGKWYRWQKRKGKEPYKIYLSEGRRVGDVWEIPIINASARERLGYPTQKPIELLKKIIKFASNENDTVLDCYCGCGTTIDAAEELKRKWIGVDITYNSICLIEYRMMSTYNNDVSYKLFGIPRDIESAKALAERTDSTRKEFEKWAILTFTNNRAMINEKKGSDGGIDGKARIHDKDGWKDVLFSVKSGNYTIDMVRAFRDSINVNNAICGFMIVMEKPTKGMIQISKELGSYKGTYVKEIPKMQFIMVQEIIDKTAEYPFLEFTMEVIKKAEKKEIEEEFEFDDD
ncbi:MAG: site-specific DNA-methyltransferase [Treponema sp.]|jgi:site-specific DNA-methyltransferase (adenine-specific)|nr:site-specific DNA-methyltransferase [Treponema sp.]